MVLARTIDGELGILPGHTPLLGVLVEGEVRIKAADASPPRWTAGSSPSTATRSSSSPRLSTPPV